MTKKAFDKIAAGLEAAIEFAEARTDIAGFRIHAPSVDVKALRDRLGLSIGDFAGRYGFAADDVRAWEQNVSSPQGAVRAYLRVIEREPDAVMRALDIRDKTAA